MSYWTDRVAYFMAREKCVRCGKQDAYTMNGHKMCYDCTIKARTYQNEHNKTRRSEINEKHKQRYERLKSEGICVNCGHREVMANKLMCPTCFIKRKLYEQKRYEQKRKEYYDSTGTC